MTKDQCIAIIDALALVAKYNAKIKVAVENKPFDPDALDGINTDFDAAIEDITEAIPDDPEQAENTPDAPADGEE